MKIEATSNLGKLIAERGGLADVIDFYGVDLAPDDLRSTVEAFCERYGLELDEILAELRHADRAEFG
jgi:hypothetical protein